MNRAAVILRHLAPLAPRQQFTLEMQGVAAAGKKPLVVVITGAAGNLAYALLFMVANGGVGGKDQPIELRLLDIPPMADKIKGVVMEVVDCAYPLVSKVVGTTDYAVAFKDVDLCLLVGAMPRGPGMQRGDLLTKNAAIFAGQGQAINKHAKRSVKVVVVGNPANTNCLIALSNAPNIKPEQFSALTRLDHNRGVGQLAERLGVGNSQIKNFTIWGNHSKTQYPDAHHATINGWPVKGHAEPVPAAVNDDKWLHGPFLSAVQDRGAAIIEVRKLSSAASAAHAVVEHARDWIQGTKEGEWVSMAVLSTGAYGVPKGIVFSYPVTCKNGSWSIVQGLKLSDFDKEKLRISAEELVDEKKIAASFIPAPATKSAPAAKK